MFSFFFFNDTATTEIYTLSLHDALPISCASCSLLRSSFSHYKDEVGYNGTFSVQRSEEHTSELQSRPHLVCRLLLEKKKYQQIARTPSSGRSRDSASFSGS